MDNGQDDKLLPHNYDGIQELDNHLPDWWLWTFFGAIIFSFVYWIHYSFSGDGKSLDQYLAEDMARIESQRSQAGQVAGGEQGPTPEELLAMGAKIYNANCASCHKEDGGGSIGPNLTDSYWIHGPDGDSIATIVKKGVLDKGMPPWEAILRPNDILAVTQYVLSFKDKNVANGKEPQGDKVN